MARPSAAPHGKATALELTPGALMSQTRENRSFTLDDTSNQRLSPALEENDVQSLNATPSRHQGSSSEEHDNVYISLPLVISSPVLSPASSTSPSLNPTLPYPESKLARYQHTDSVLYQAIRNQVIEDVCAYLRHNQRLSVPPTVLNIGSRLNINETHERSRAATPVSDIISYRENLGQHRQGGILEPSEYVLDSQYYNPTHKSHSVASNSTIHRLSLQASPRLRAQDLSTINETPNNNRADEHAIRDTASIAPSTDTGIPELKWRDIAKWPGFIATLPSFTWYCIHDHFYHNPYKLPPAIYVCMAVGLTWCIVVRLVVIILHLRLMMTEPWSKELERESIRQMNDMVGILPITVQFVLFLFPPLLANISS